MYEGSPQAVFWGFIEPFLKDGIKSILRLVVDECANRELDPEEYLDEASTLLISLVEKTWRGLAST
uniref:Uncharacterized protein n=1 Tax=Candidatus Kentrum sp. UNK TaxID=2126344 RepID=A0A451AU33_9GAMM|nr:MAG: hypothetical protein BECKUNK1418G_GA0071005_10783 [Candidatus Kentron sp. UNK]VFK69407.1 MAG: hypothetical protein BECKUNK1418H_GA0071006_101326 [Candidatus Kentron sp. UNK]